MSLSTRVVFVSRSLLACSIKNGTAKEEKSLLIGGGSSNGVDTSYFNKNAINREERQSMIEKYGLANKIVIGFVGRVTRDKGSLSCWRHSNNQMLHSNCKLITMGHVKCPADFKQRYEANPDVVHIPFQDNVPLYMSLFDMLVWPSWREGFPNALREAMAGCACNSFDFMAGPREILTDGKDGLSVPPNNVEAFAEKN